MRLNDFLVQMQDMESKFAQTVKSRNAADYALSEIRMEVLRHLQKNCNHDADYPDTKGGDEYFKTRLDEVAHASSVDRPNLLASFEIELNHSVQACLVG